MITISQDVLVALWESSETVESMAERLGCRPQDIRGAWRKLRTRGELPRGDRPRNRGADERATPRSPTGDDSDGRPPSADDYDYDPLLEQLRLVHPEMVEKMNRDEHVARAKKRAHDYLANNQLGNAVTSMISDMQDLGEVSPELMHAGGLAAESGSALAVRRFIDGFR